MNNFHSLITPERAIARGDSRSVEELRILTTLDEVVCLQCRNRTAWRYAGLGLCFTCTTGETDASRDFELVRLSLRSFSTAIDADEPEGSDGWMEKHGFIWETFDKVNPRWRHVPTGVTVWREAGLTNEEWAKRKIEGVRRISRTAEQRNSHAPHLSVAAA